MANKKLVVSVGPAGTENRPLSVHQSPRTVMLANEFVGKFVVFSPAGNIITQPTDNELEATEYAKSLAKSGKAAVVMTVVAQYT